MPRVGIDIGGSSIKAVRLEGDARETARVPHADATPSGIAQAVRDAADRVGVEPSDPVGLCLPGIRDAATGVLTHAANLPRLVGTDPAELVATALGRPPSVVLTDAAGWGLGVHAREPTIDRLLVLAIGTGIGGALIVNGEPLTLDGLTPGHIGMIDVSLGEPDPPRARDGTPGVLEAYAGGAALIARFGERDLADAISNMPADDPALRALAKSLRICHAIYKPDAIRLVGGLGAMLAPHRDTLDALIRTDLTSVAGKDWTLAVIDDPFLAAEGAARATRPPAPSPDPDPDSTRRSSPPTRS